MKFSREHRKNIGLSQLGNKRATGARSPEAKKNISLATKAAWVRRKARAAGETTTMQINNSQEGA